MAKNKHSKPLSDFDRLNQRGAISGTATIEPLDPVMGTQMVSHPGSDDEPTTTTVVGNPDGANNSDDDSEIGSPDDTDVLPPKSPEELEQEAELARMWADSQNGLPPRLSRKAVQAANTASNAWEQEQLLARYARDPNFDRNHDPAVNYQRAISLGAQVPEVVIRKDADPLLTESFRMFERLLAAGYIVPTAPHVYNELVSLTLRLKAELEAKPEENSSAASPAQP